MNLRKIFVILIIVLSFPLSMGASAYYNFQYLTRKDGLCGNTIHSTYMDKNGFIWICTGYGMDRYDGTDFIHFSTSSKDSSTRLISNFIIGVMEDKVGNLWIASDNGLMCFNFDSGSIVEAYNTDMKNSEYLSASIEQIVCDEMGNLWIASLNRLLLLLLDEDGKITKIDCRTIESGNICDIAIHQNDIWVASDDSISRFTSSSGNIEEISINPINSLQEIKNAHALYSNGDYLWIGTSDNGLFCFNSINKKTQHYSHNPYDNKSLSDNNIRCINADRSGNIIVGTNSGLNILRQGVFEHIGIAEDTPSINDPIISHIFTDYSGNIWVSTLFGGVNILSAKKIDFSILLNDQNNSFRTVLNDQDGNLIIGNYKEGISVIRKGSEQIIFPNKNGELPKIINTITQSKDGNYWLATAYGVYEIQKDGFPDILNIKSYNTSNSELSGNYVRDIKYDAKRDQLWICTSLGVDMLDIKKDAITPILSYNSEELEMYNTLYIDSWDRIWIGGNGVSMISIIEEENGKCRYESRHFKHKLDMPDRDISERIISILETSNGEIYFGSQNNGVYMLNEDVKGEISFISIPINMPEENKSVSFMIEDQNNNIWMGIPGGLYKYNTKKKIGNIFSSNEGFNDTRFFVNSGCLVDENIVLSTTNSILVIHSSIDTFDSFKMDRKVHFTSVRYADKTIISKNLEKIEITPDTPSFGITFSALNYEDSQNITYATMLDGVDKDWVTNPSNFLNFSNMSHGEYTLRVRCTNLDGSWSAQESEIKILIQPHFWQTGWFSTIIFILLLSIAAFYIVHILNKEKETNDKLSTIVEEKTKNLSDTMAVVQKQNLEIQEQKDQLEDYAKEIKKVDKEKMQIMTNLTHEFKTPLTLILGPLRQIQENLKDKSLYPALQIIERNSKYLLSLVNQFMDLRMVDSGNIAIKHSSFYIKQVEDNISSDFEPMFQERQLNYRFVNRILHNNIVSDKTIIHNIMTNLFSNAIKFTPNGGSITLYLAQWESEQDGVIMQYISVHNTGSYISDEEKEKVFGSFYKIENQSSFTGYGQSSTGIGLYLVKELVSSLGGRIEIRSSKKTGTAFRIYFPVEIAQEAAVNLEKNVSDINKATVEGANDMEIPFNPSATKKPVLLLVEDNKDMREYIKGLLSDKYDIAEATNGQKGYDMACNIIPDFIVSDLMMPICNGIEFSKMVHSNANLCHIPFLMLTALSVEDARLKAYKAGADSYLTKPFNPEMLIARIENILENRKNRQTQMIVNLDEAYAKVDIEKPDKLFMERISQIMKENYSDPDFNVAELVSAAGMSSTSFYKKITALTGLTTTHYMRLYRLQTAMHIIEENKDEKGLNVSEVAYMVGFNDPKYFTRCFVAQYGVKPSSLMGGANNNNTENNKNT